MTMDEIFARHTRVALMFSGGKDSLACLELARPYLDRAAVIWVNTGAALPEIVELMNRVRQECKWFFEVLSDQPGGIEVHGYPVDVLPVNNTVLGQDITSRNDIKLRSYLNCCSENIWAPADKMARDLQVTAVVRGQRNSEKYKGPVKSGTVSQGIEYCFPIDDWSKEQVHSFLQSRGYEIDDRLELDHSSLDCWNCTAYLSGTKDRMVYMKKHHPEMAKEVVSILRRIDKAVRAEHTALEEMVA